MKRISKASDTTPRSDNFYNLLLTIADMARWKSDVNIYPELTFRTQCLLPSTPRWQESDMETIGPPWCFVEKISQDTEVWSVYWVAAVCHVLCPQNGRHLGNFGDFGSLFLLFKLKNEHIKSSDFDKSPVANITSQNFKSRCGVSGLRKLVVISAVISGVWWSEPLNIHGNISNWWLSPTPLKNDGLRQIGSSSKRKWGNQSHVPNHQPDMIYGPLWEVQLCHEAQGNHQGHLLLAFRDELSADRSCAETWGWLDPK